MNDKQVSYRYKGPTDEYTVESKFRHKMSGLGSEYGPSAVTSGGGSPSRIGRAICTALFLVYNGPASLVIYSPCFVADPSKHKTCSFLESRLHRIRHKTAGVHGLCRYHPIQFTALRSEEIRSSKSAPNRTFTSYIGYFYTTPPPPEWQITHCILKM